MQPMRHIVDDMPELYPVPPDIQHRRVEIIFWPLDDTSPAASFKQWLGSMPDVGEDADFARPLDMGRKDEPRGSLIDTNVLNPFTGTASCRS